MKLSSYNPFVADLAGRGLEYAAEHAASLGFDAVEWLERCPTGEGAAYKKYDAAYVREVLARHGLTVSCFSVFANTLHEDHKAVDATLRSQIEYAAAIGSPAFHHTVIPWLTLPENAPTYDEVFECVLAYETEISNACRANGLLSLYEPQGMYFNGTEGLSRLIEALRAKGCDNVGLCADVGNSYYIDVPPMDIFETLGQYTGQIHLKDMRMTSTEQDIAGKMHRSLGGKYLYDTALGEGDVDIEGSLRILLRSGYDGALSFEIDGDDEYIRRSIGYVKALLARLSAE